MNTFEKLGAGRYRSRYTALCRKCNGAGFFQDQDHLPEKCHTCDGTGKVRVTKDINVIVEPYNTHTK